MRKLIYQQGVFIEAGGQAYRVRELQPKNFPLQFRIVYAIKAFGNFIGNGKFKSCPEGAVRIIMYFFGVHLEKQRT